MMTTKNLRRILSIFLSLSYGVGAIVSALLEYRNQLFSERFELSSGLVLIVFAVQLVCAVGVLIPRYIRASTVCLTVTTIGAIYAHLKIGSPESSIAAVVYTAIQIWLWILAGRQDANGPTL